MSQAIRVDEALSSLQAANPVAVSDALLTPAETEALRVRAIDIAAAADEPRDLIAPPTSGRRRLGLRAAAVAAGVAVIGVIALVGLGSPGQSRSDFTAEAIEVAEANPRLLVTEPGWPVSYVDWTDPKHGSLQFSDGDPLAGDHVAELTWAPANEYRGFFNDRKHGAEIEEVQVLGQQATLFSSANTHTTIFPPDGTVFLEFRADFLSRSDYLDLLHSLRATDVETWLSAMPPGVVRPGDRDPVIDGMLADIPLPPGFDTERLKEETTGDVSGRYQLGADVTQAVTCAWVHRWRAARSAGDTATMREAVDALSTTRDWDILKEMASEGGWSVEVWRYADLLRQGSVDKSIYEQQMNCIEFPWVEQ